MAIRTAEQLLRAGDIGRCELIRGELRMMIPASFEHGRITMKLTGPILNHVGTHGLGAVVAAETGFLLAHDPDTVRAPDIAFVRGERLPELQRGFFPGAPDLAAEVLSPDDRTVTVHVPARRPDVFRETDVLPGGDVLPGFALPVRDVFV